MQFNYPVYLEDCKAPIMPSDARLSGSAGRHEILRSVPAPAIGTDLAS